MSLAIRAWLRAAGLVGLWVPAFGGIGREWRMAAGRGRASKKRAGEEAILFALPPPLLVWRPAVGARLAG